MYSITSKLRAQHQAEAVQHDHSTLCSCCPCYAAKKVSSIKLPGILLFYPSCLMLNNIPM